MSPLVFFPQVAAYMASKRDSIITWGNIMEIFWTGKHIIEDTIQYIRGCLEIDYTIYEIQCGNIIQRHYLQVERNTNTYNEDEDN